ncbi:hypothetical protein [Desulfosporosinus acididurans]|uniref:hypothetical protein n=1 Tax=Desulfosporosinus acididurans TaxID=476652 RepID=UPI0006492D6E|nr:hypothetical protein [Desulfosporosinus acididurans]
MAVHSSSFTPKKFSSLERAQQNLLQKARQYILNIQIINSALIAAFSRQLKQTKKISDASLHRFSSFYRKIPDALTNQ